MVKCTQPPDRRSDKNGKATGRKSRRKAVFAFKGHTNYVMQQDSEEQNALRTRAYIDGYNLYYGCLKRRLTSGRQRIWACESRALVLMIPCPRPPMLLIV